MGRQEREILECFSRVQLKARHQINTCFNERCCCLIVIPKSKIKVEIIPTYCDELLKPITQPKMIENQKIPFSVMIPLKLFSNKRITKIKRSSKIFLPE